MPQLHCSNQMSQGDWLATASLDKTIKLFDVENFDMVCPTPSAALIPLAAPPHTKVAGEHPGGRFCANGDCILVGLSRRQNPTSCCRCLLLSVCLLLCPVCQHSSVCPFLRLTVCNCLFSSCTVCLLYHFKCSSGCRCQH